MVGVQPPLVYDDFFGFNLHSTVLLGYFGFVFFFSLFIFQHGKKMVVFKPCRFFMHAMQHGDFKIFENFLEVNNFVSVDFQTQVSI